MMKARPLRVVMLAMEGVSPIHLAVPATVFGDRHVEGLSFDFCACAETPGVLQTSVAMGVALSEGLNALELADVVIVPSWPDPSKPPSDGVVRALKAADQRGATIMGLCLGSYVLAYSGLLNGRSATTHWRFVEPFKEMFPEVDLRADQIYVQSDRIWTSAGVAAGFDCALEFISQTFGAASADAIARNLVLPSHRTAVRRQVIEAPVAARSKDRRLNALLDEIRADLGKARSIDTVAAELGMSRRTFTRRFRDHVGMAFGDWLLEERVKAARIVLEASNEPIDALSSRLGFSSPAAFRDQFERRFGRMPADWRHAHRLSPMELF